MVSPEARSPAKLPLISPCSSRETLWVCMPKLNPGGSGWSIIKEDELEVAVD